MNDQFLQMLNRLTPKEREVCIELIRSSLSIKEIAAKLGREYNTVRTQAERIFRKLNVHSRAELMLKGNVPAPPIPNVPPTPHMPPVGPQIA